MEDLMLLAERIGARLKASGATIAIAESSAGGLIAAALVAVPGASAYFSGGAVVYTRRARAALLGIPDSAMSGMRPSTEAYAVLLARTVRERFDSAWGLSETGATGPAGNHYGDKPGHACFALVGAGVERVITIETDRDDRRVNMRTFASRALELLAQELSGPP
jgi:nicotinamide-nucleotide amidase